VVKETTADALRREFDDSFRAAPPEPVRHDVFLAIRVAGTARAIRLDQVSQLCALPPLVALPGGRPGLLGIVELGGELVAVYDIASILGVVAGGDPAWVVLTATPERVGLAFEGLLGQVRVPEGTAVLEMIDTPYGPCRLVDLDPLTKEL
jgi:hypothetical protein